jgi:hypothetical protein
MPEKVVNYIRALGPKEVYNIFNIDYDILIGTIKVSSRIDFNSSQDLVAQAINEWKRLNPALRWFAKIEKDHSTDENAVYFVEASAEKQKEPLHNVEFLSYTSDSNDLKNIDQHLIKLLSEKEVNMKFDLSSELMWRLKFFKLEQTQTGTNDLFKYCVLFSVHHSICEARYKYLGNLIYNI